MLTPTGSQSTLDQAVITKYDAWKAAFIKHNCGNGWTETISPDADHPYVAEGQGYGMVITATMAGADSGAKANFDGMVKYMLAHPSVHNSNLLAAEQDSSCTSVDGSDSATDGDLDVPYGLLLADRQWSSSGTYNYKDLAIKHINAIKSNEVNPTTHYMLLGDWSTSGEPHYWMTRSSDFLIDHFRAFKKATGDSTWDAIRTAHQDLITSQQANYASPQACWRTSSSVRTRRRSRPTVRCLKGPMTATTPGTPAAIPGVSAPTPSPAPPPPHSPRRASSTPGSSPRPAATPATSAPATTSMARRSTAATTWHSPHRSSSRRSPTPAPGLARRALEQADRHLDRPLALLRRQRAAPIHDRRIRQLLGALTEE
ncbi:glycosyl hydrolase family 8 [Streptomyces sp. NPDC006733]|uniref:glycosyl hydrolase family 8 n=1 Tax=Streptomyces sp. NPDC006733 TaxID=3155460 RepID=UPI0033E6FA88